MDALDDIDSEKCISIETYRKNDEPVQTPVWFIIKNNLIYVVTRDKTGKIKRLKNNQKIKVATCSFKGKIIGKWRDGTATILDDEQTKRIAKLRDKKYGFMAKVAKFFSKNKELIAFSIKLN